MKSCKNGGTETVAQRVEDNDVEKYVENNVWLYLDTSALVRRI